MADSVEEQNRRMKAMSDEAREAAIAAAPNVIGFERFRQRDQSVALRDAYRAPQKPGPGGKA